MKIIKTETVYSGFFKVEKITLQHQNDTFSREIYHNLNAVAALVYDKSNDQYILTEQYRIAADSPMVEVVAGLMDKEYENPEETIAREIMEEVGYKTDSLYLITEFFTSPGACAEKIRLYYAEVSQPEGIGGGVDSEQENIKIMRYSKEELYSHTFIDAKTIIAVQWLKNRIY